MLRLRQVTVIFCGLVSSAISQAQSLEALVENSRLAMHEENWQQALKWSEEAVARYGRNGPYESYGAQFGTIYYRQGICEMKLKRWPAAMASFEACYRDFPNRNADQGNPFQKMALLKWGESAMGAEQWELAKSRFDKFMDERDRANDVFPKGAFYINLAICEYQLGNIAAGNENLEIAIHNRLGFPTPDTGIVAAFQALVKVSIDKQVEQVLLDFVDRNRGELVMDSGRVSSNATIYLKLAGDALAAGMQRAALLLYQLVPLSEGDENNAIRLAAVAVIHERSGNVRGAFAAYQQLEWYMTETPRREEYLYHLIRTAALIRENDLASYYGRRFLTDFPDSPYRSEIRPLSEENIPLEERPVIGESAETGVEIRMESQELMRAVDLYEGRKYQQAKLAFSKINMSQANESDRMLAAFYEMECLRRMGDWEAMASALGTFVGDDAFGPHQRRQLEINRLWEVAGVQDWPQLKAAVENFRCQRLRANQRSQVAYLEGLALQNLGQSSAALNAYNAAMTADAGASEELTRQAALRVMEIHMAAPESATAMAQAGVPAEDRQSLGYLRWREAAAVAALFEASLGAGTPLPEPLRKLRNHAEVDR